MKNKSQPGNQLSSYGACRILGVLFSSFHICTHSLQICIVVKLYNFMLQLLRMHSDEVFSSIVAFGMKTVIKLNALQQIVVCCISKPLSLWIRQPDICKSAPGGGDFNKK